MNKWIYIFILCFGLSLLFGSVTNVSYAWSTTKQDLTDKLEILGQKGVIGEYVFEDIDLNYYFSDSYTKYAIIIGKGTSGKLGTYTRLYIYMGNGTQIYNSSNEPSSNLYYNWAYSGGDYVCYNTSTGNTLSQGLYQLNDLQEPFYAYTTIPINTRVLTLAAGEEHGGHYFTSPISFELASGDLLTSFEGYSNVYAIKETYQNFDWYIGTFNGLDSVSEVECKLIDLETQANIGNKYKSLLVNDSVYYNSRLLEFGHVYRFYYDAYLDGSIIKNEFYDIVFASYNSGDSFNLQDLTNAILENQLTVSDLTNVLGEYPSGDGEPTGFLGGLLKGIKGLFIPSDGFLGSYFSDLNDWFSQRLGILYFPFDFIFGFLNRILTIDFSEPHMELGPYQLPDYSGDVVPKINIEFNNFLQDELVNNIHDIYLLIVDGLLVFWLVRLFQKKYDEVIGGKGQ